ncbi:MAG: TonB-dependent receptor plug domain-containing protein [Alphaproteobacteria bacterium]|nr:TonB-dependent receptor plug domain-containing protein [Alphaproteobacteria bacterium]
MRRKITLTRLALSGVSLAAMGAVAPAAFAQDSGGVSDEIIVTAQKREQAIQDVPIAVSAFGLDALEDQGLDGGYDLVQAIPNVSFSRGNFTGYNFQIRGVGAKVVAAGGDAGVGVHLNNAPLSANRLFEADFYDVERVEVLRGPQGTLFGRNATGGVVNVITRTPNDVFEGSIRGEIANYNSTRLTGVLNVPIIGDDVMAIRLAATRLERDGFGTNTVTNSSIDERDIWSGRVTVSFNPTDNIRTWLMYEHFEEDDNRVRVGKQLCDSDPGPASIGGAAVLNPVARGWFSQGCLPNSLYSPESLEAVNTLATLGGSLGALIGILSGDANAGYLQDPNLRNIESGLEPIYQAEADVYMFNATIDLTPTLTLTSLSSYNEDEFFSFQDYNRISAPTTFNFVPGLTAADGTFCDPQLGCSNQFRTFDISSASSTQFTQEIRLQSNFDGPLNFNIGGIYVDFSADPVDYYVFSNSLTAAALGLGIPPALIDPGFPPNAEGRNYYLNRSFYDLEAWAAMGEVYYEPVEDLTFTLGLRYTVDQKEVRPVAPVLLSAAPTPPVPVQEAEFEELTGRIGFDWQLDTGFTNDTLLYAFYSRGYKGGGFNPPSSVGIAGITETFDPEFVDAIEIGLKNTLFDGTMILNGTGFFYDYQGYQISKIVNRSSVNENIDAEVRGFELESIWEPMDGLRFNVTAGWLDTEITGGSSLDTFDRIQGNDAIWTLIHDPLTAQNCVIQTAVLTAPQAALGGASFLDVINGTPAALGNACGAGNPLGLSALTFAGEEVNLTGKELPNSPDLTYSIGAEYEWGLGGAWTATARADYYYQGEAYTRIFNIDADRLDGYTNLNLLFRVANEDQQFAVELFVQNATDEVAITDAYLTDDSSGLFRNIFLTEPRIFGLRLSKGF